MIFCICILIFQKKSNTYYFAPFQLTWFSNSIYTPSAIRIRIPEYHRTEIEIEFLYNIEEERIIIQ